MLDIKFVRENPEIVKQNIRNKFQDKKLVLVDEVLELDKRNREIKAEVEALRANRNKVSKEIGKLMGQGKREEAMAIKEEIAKQGARVDELTEEEKKVEEELKMLKFRSTASRWSRILISRITQISWRDSTESIWKPPAALQVMDSTI